jgi:hypothetical protein
MPCKMIGLDSRTFHRLLGPCNEFFQEGMKKY